jgi:hypothetical protein
LTPREARNDKLHVERHALDRKLMDTYLDASERENARVRVTEIIRLLSKEGVYAPTPVPDDAVKPRGGRSTGRSASHGVPTVPSTDNA